MIVNNTGMKPERRKGPDIWVKALGWFVVFGWFLMFVALFIIDRAKPEDENIFTKAAEIEVRTTWNQELINYLFYLMIFGLCISIIGIVINSRRHHREDDRFRLTLIILGITSILGIIKYLFSF
ncbi:MAG: hypothetical protein SCARUB_00469 [Candidatus Scalindua rubra]|uniref:Uncharacterized protein n=1 Tax=Candidatus Scalindua rubra TaxID=1872076 RepID=A0A1E3XFG5_9BACT|nr:MAG: hypothetical protein SCARUB_00469 [Candidatus Scalindua rubra]